MLTFAFEINNSSAQSVDSYALLMGNTLSHYKFILMGLRGFKVLRGFLKTLSGPKYKQLSEQEGLVYFRKQDLAQTFSLVYHL